MLGVSKKGDKCYPCSMLGWDSFPNKSLHSCTVSHIVVIQNAVPPYCPSCQYSHILCHEGLISFIIKIIWSFKSILVNLTAQSKEAC